ncbi:MAG: magnesium transporter, partial [Alphaproteobacteria bacterium]|nr:magnesium transporter [Alphaproteobacteria bacterium]
MSDTSTPSPAEQRKIDPVFLDDLADAIDGRDVRWLSRTLKRMHPADAADALEALSYDTFEEAVELLGGELPPEILIELRDSYREGAVEMLPDRAVA